MKLTKIEIVGFKSFRHKTTIELRSGITAVVGPNGSGKSNVIDAIRWVLGENSPRQLRISAMSELLFNGGTDFSSSNYAQVALMFDNSLQVIPHKSTEVSISRRLYRDGDSHFFIDDEEVRLRDIREVFANAGMSFSPSLIISQGQADQILSAKPEERRKLFEQASGILGYRKQYLESRQLLNKTREQAKQLQPIVTELEKSYTRTKQQAQRTEQHRELKSKLRTQRMRRDQAKYHAIVTDESGNKTALAQLKQQRQQLNDTLYVYNQNNQLLSQQIADIRAEHKLSSGKQYELQIEIERMQSSINLLIEKNKQVDEQFQLFKQHELGFISTSKILSDERTSLSNRIKDITRTSLEHKTARKECEKKIATLREQGVRYQQIIKENADKIPQLTQQQSELRSQKTALSEQIVNKITQLTSHTEQSTTPTTTKKRPLGVGTRLHDMQELIAGGAKHLESLRHIIASSLPTQSSTQTQLERVLLHLQEITNDISAVHQQLQSSVTELVDQFEPLIKFLSTPGGLFAQFVAIDTEIGNIDHQIERIIADNESFNNEQQTIQGAIASTTEQQHQLTVHIERDKAIVHQISDRITEIDKQLAHNRSKIDQEKQKIDSLQQSMQQHQDKIIDKREQLEALKTKLKQIEVDITHHTNQDNVLSKRFAAAEKKTEESSRKLKQVTERIEAATQRYSHSQAKLEQFTDRYLEEYGEEIPQSCTPLSPHQLQRIDQQVASITKQIHELGTVNYMAAVEHKDYKRRYELIHSQLTDYENACKELEKVTANIDRQSTEILTKCVTAVSEQFNTIVGHFFNGGKGKLVVQQPDDILNSGIDIVVRPFGKQPEQIEQLSGGERSMAVISLLFALNAYSPAHILVMDEIDAALDENNIENFSTYLQDVLSASQIIIITHNRGTMSVADVLVGVTMQQPGVSKVVEIAVADYVIADTEV